MIRRVVEHTALSPDRERLKVVTVFEPGINKERAKKMIGYSRRHYVLINRKGDYEWK